MVARSSRFLSCLAVLGFLTLAACSAKLELIMKSAVVPVGVDLSGRWLARDREKTRRPTSGNDEDGIDVSERKRSSRSRKSRKGSGSSVQVFLEYGHSLKITQTQFAVFISYDRSIVEEFRFGENRQVAVGPIEAMRVSGWEGNVLVIQTIDDSYSILAESWQLESDDQVLVRDIRISNGELEMFSQQQVFDRQ
jgi:hypothetical protein